ncbi:MAG TPA: hypothetical protein VM145_07835 [Sphingomicrobium sp.]|nr:hypothetical protein [Sphingomicrobium sp.]
MHRRSPSALRNDGGRIHTSLTLLAYAGFMLHLLRNSQPEPRPLAYAEAVSRLASVRHAMKLVEPFGSGPASDPSGDDALANAWDVAGEARQRHFDRRSGALVGAAAAGLEALLIERQEGRDPHAEATQAMVDEIRRELHDVAGILLA